MKRITVLTALTALAALWTITGFAPAPVEAADIPKLINFQGILRDGSGNPVADGVYTVRFRIYDDSTAGSTLWEETVPVPTVSGLFTVRLGDGTALPDNLFAAGINRFVGVKVNLDAEMPRLRLISVPFAFHALRSDTAATATVALNLTCTGCVDASDIDATQVQRRVTGTAGAGEYITGINQDGSVTTAVDQVGAASGWTDDGAIVRLTTSTDNVGIGTSAPGSRLHIREDIDGVAALVIDNQSAGTSSLERIEFRSEDGVIGSATIAVFDNSSPSAPATMRFANNLTGGNVDLITNGQIRLKIENGGNVGIGTASPASRLDVAGGNFNLENSTAAAGNILKGGGLFVHNFGTNNTFTGFNAGNLTLTGLNNSAFGTFALQNITDGFRNSAVGTEALRFNTTGDQNTAIGYRALLNNLSGNLNCAFGAFAMDGNTTGESNTASGAFCLAVNTDGDNNTVAGNEAMRYNTIGSNNTAHGRQALLVNSTGNNNSAYGAFSLVSNTSGTGNTAAGYQALYSNTTDYNTAVGYRSLFLNTSGNGNTAIGAFSLDSNTTGFSNTACGSLALRRNTTAAHNSAFGQSALSNSTGFQNTSVGASSMYSNTTGNNNTALGMDALRDNLTGNGNTAIGFEADVSAGNLSNATAIGYQAVVNASNKIRLGNAFVTVIEGQVAYTFPSDKNLKESFQPVDGEEVLRKLRGFNLTSWNYKGHDPKQFRHYGPMAQDFFAAFGDDGVGKIGTETTLNSGDVAGILMAAVQALEKRTAENEQLRQELKGLRELVQELLAEKKKEEEKKLGQLR